MNRALIHRVAMAGLVHISLAACSWGKNWIALPAEHQCLPQKSTIIAAENRCVEAGGIDIGYYGDDGIKVACMRDKRVQGACGPDGSVTRLHAYVAWMTKLKQFQD